MINLENISLPSQPSIRAFAGVTFRFRWFCRPSWIVNNVLGLIQTRANVFYHIIAMQKAPSHPEADRRAAGHFFKGNSRNPPVPSLLAGEEGFQIEFTPKTSPSDTIETAYLACPLTQICVRISYTRNQLLLIRLLNQPILVFEIQTDLIKTK